MQQRGQLSAYRSTTVTYREDKAVQITGDPTSPVRTEGEEVSRFSKKELPILDGGASDCVETRGGGTCEEGESSIGRPARRRPCYQRTSGLRNEDSSNEGGFKKENRWLRNRRCLSSQKTRWDLSQQQRDSHLAPHESERRFKSNRFSLQGEGGEGGGHIKRGTLGRPRRGKKGGKPVRLQGLS